MRVECTRSDDATILAVAGELDVATAPILEKRVRDLIGDGRVKLIFDFSDLEHITSSGLAVLALCLQLIKPKQGRIAVASAAGLVKEVIDVWAGKHSSFVPSFATVDEALDSFAREN